MGFIVPSIWNDREWTALGEFEQTIWIFLLTTEHAIGLPGLIKLGPGSIAELAHKDGHRTRQALDMFVSMRWVYMDLLDNIIRIPAAPKYNPPANPNHVRGWFRKWRPMQHCQIALDHVSSLRDAVSRVANASEKRAGAGWITAWNETFGQFEPLTPIAKQGSLFSGLNGKPKPDVKAFQKSNSNAGELVDIADELLSSSSVVDVTDHETAGVCVQGVKAFNEGFPEETGSRSHTQRSEIQIPDPQIQIPDGSAEGRTPGARVLPLHRFGEGTSPGGVLEAQPDTACERLWELQEDLRAPLTGGGRARPTSANLADVAACLAEVGGDVETVEKILRSFAVESRGYLIGGTNWKLSVFSVELAKLHKPKHAGGYYKPKEGQKFGDGKSVITRK